MEFSQQLVGTLKVSSFLEITVDDDGSDGVSRQRRLCWPAIDLSIAESMKGKLGLPGLRSIAVQDQRVSSFGGS